MVLVGVSSRQKGTKQRKIIKGRFGLCVDHKFSFDTRFGNRVVIDDSQSNLIFKDEFMLG